MLLPDAPRDRHIFVCSHPYLIRLELSHHPKNVEQVTAHGVGRVVDSPRQGSQRRTW